MEQEILVLGFQGYDFDDSNNSRQQGGKLFYIGNYSLSLDLKKGCIPMKSATELNYGKTLNNGVYPFIAKALFVQVPDSKGNPIMTIASLQDIRTFEVSKIFTSK